MLPRWLAELDHTEALGRAVEISTVYRDVDQLLVAVMVPGDHPLTAVVLVDNELGSFAAEGFVLQSSMDDAIPLLLKDAGPDVRVRDISTAEARARIDDALRELDLGPGTGGYDSWAESRPLVKWMLTLLPEGGDGYVLNDLSDHELDEIGDRFVASPLVRRGRTTTSGLHRRGRRGRQRQRHRRSSRLEPGQRPQTPRPVSVVAGPLTPSLERAPELLRDLIRFGHAERGLRPELTAASLDAVDVAAGPFPRGLAGAGQRSRPWSTRR